MESHFREIDKLILQEASHGSVRTCIGDAMFKNYLTVAIRNLMRNKVYSTLNVLGLGIGIACCLLIVLFLQHELRYDRFHKNGDRIYKVVFETQNENGSRTIQWSTSGALGPALKRDFPEVVETVRLWNKMVGVERQDRMLRARLSLVDKRVFDVFDLVFVKGDPQTAFQDPSGMLIGVDPV
jgi:putative ABC transport system permease protein